MKIFRAADAFCARRREGPYRFIQNRSRTSVVAPKSGAAAEKVQGSTFARFLGVFDFRLLQQYRHFPDVEAVTTKVRLREAKRTCRLSFGQLPSCRSHSTGNCWRRSSSKPRVSKIILNENGIEPSDNFVMQSEHEASS